ncbi:MAG: MFS transporter [Spirochaetota bacterium]
MFFLGVGVAIVGATARMVGLDPAEIGYLIAVQNVGFGLAVFVAGRLSDRLRKASVLPVGLLLSAVAFLLLYRSESLAVNLAVVAMLGAGMGVAEAVTDAWLLELHERNESRLITINHLAVSVGSVIITLYLMALRLDWRLSLTQIALALAILAVLVAFLRGGAVSSSPDSPGSLRSMVTDRGLVLLIVAAMGTVGIEAGSAGVLTTVAMELRGLSLDGAQALLALYLVGLAGGRVIVGAIGDRWRPETILIASAALTLGSAIVVYALPVNGTPFIVAVGVLGIAAGPLLPLIIAAAGLRYRLQAGSAMGIVKVAIPVGGILIPGIAGVVADAASFQRSLVVFPIAALLILCSALVIARSP